MNEESQIIDVTEKPNILVRAFQGFKSGLASAFGQLASRQFWIDLAAKVVHEMISSFLKTVGAKLLTIGVSREDPEVKRSAQTFQQGGNAAFSNNNYPPRYSTPAPSTPDYSSRYSSNTTSAVAPRTDNKFPGW